MAAVEPKLRSSSIVDNIETNFNGKCHVFEDGNSLALKRMVSRVSRSRISKKAAVKPALPDCYCS